MDPFRPSSLSPSPHAAALSLSPDVSRRGETGIRKKGRGFFSFRTHYVVVLVQ